MRHLEHDHGYGNAQGRTEGPLHVRQVHRSTVGATFRQNASFGG